MLRFALAFVAVLLPVVSAFAAQCKASSPAHTLALVELYSSEGCSSCPPADEWLSSLEKQGYGIDRIAPVAFHVDYWDYIGWKDRFADPRYSVRQRNQAAIERSRAIYTPQVVLAGRDFRKWSSHASLESTVLKANAQPARAKIELTLSPDADGRFNAVAIAQIPEAGERGRETSERGRSTLHFALLESGLSTPVAAGENRGATLRHDRVARAYVRTTRFDASGRAELRLSARLDSSAGKPGAIAFVQRDADGEVLQALSVPTCGV